MKTQIIEVTQGSEFNWGKFIVMEFDEEWKRTSSLPGNDLPMPLLRQRGWASNHVFVADLETGEGAMFSKFDRFPLYTLHNKHRIWVCPMFEPFLVWLCEQDFESVTELPEYVKLDTDIEAMAGYRRGPVDADMADIWRGIDAIVEAAVHYGVNDEVAAAIAHVDRVLRRRYKEPAARSA